MVSIPVVSQNFFVRHWVVKQWSRHLRRRAQRTKVCDLGMGQNWKPRGPEIQMYSLYWDPRCHFTVNHLILPVSKFDPYPFLKWEYDMEYEWNIQLSEEIWFFWMGWSVRNQSNPLIGFNILKCMFFPPARWGSLDFSKGAIPLLLPTLLPAPPSPRVLLFQLVVTLPPMDPSHITSSAVEHVCIKPYRKLRMQWRLLSRIHGSVSKPIVPL